MRQETCEQRVDNELRDRIQDLGMCIAEETDADGYEMSLCEYGLGFDYVAANTFDDQKEGYFRYQLSWGGPSDEFRFFVDRGGNCHRIEYWFLDWFDGAPRTLCGEDEELLMQIFDWFRDLGIVESELERAREA